MSLERSRVYILGCAKLAQQIRRRDSHPIARNVTRNATLGTHLLAHLTAKAVQMSGKGAIAYRAEMLLHATADPEKCRRMSANTDGERGGHTEKFKSLGPWRLSTLQI